MRDQDYAELVDGIGVEYLPIFQWAKAPETKEVEYRLGPLRAFATKMKKPVYLIDSLLITDLQLKNSGRVAK